MMCEQCGKNAATTHIHTVINGVVTEKNLCGYCAANMSFGNNGIMNMLASMFGESLREIPGISEIRCECCGASFSDIAETGKAGCSNCYKTFEKQFMPSLQRLHGKTKHIGKKPPYHREADEKADKIKALKKQLDEAIKTEKFERAAVLRDEIKKAEGEE